MIESGLVAFDMDDTLLNGRVVFKAAEHWGFKETMLEIMNSSIEKYKQSETIATLFKGLDKEEILEIVKKIPLTTGCEETVKTLKAAGYKIGIISDSYTFVTGYLKNRLALDFDEHMPLGWQNNNCTCKRSVCKRMSLRRQAAKLGLTHARTFAIGDNLSDICMLEEASVSIAFNPKYPDVSNTAQYTVHGDLRKILQYIPTSDRISEIRGANIDQNNVEHD
jgi:HAD superfamily phosphoserine phosphatase-like hydrolase